MAERNRLRNSPVLASLAIIAASVLALAVLAAAARLIDAVLGNPVLSVFVAALLLTAAGWAALLYRRRENRLAAEYQRMRRARWEAEVARSREIDRYLAMDHKQFEHALAFLCTRDGCTDVTVTGKSGDFGADVVAYAPDGRKIVLQAKRYAPTTKVGSQDMQRFGGTCFSYHNAAVAAVVTTSTFTRNAVDYAARVGIRLVDLDGLTAWATGSGPAPWH